MSLEEQTPYAMYVGHHSIREGIENMKAKGINAEILEHLIAMVMFAPSDTLNLYRDENDQTVWVLTSRFYVIRSKR